jgi:hypothetical protein
MTPLRSHNFFTLRRHNFFFSKNYAEVTLVKCGEGLIQGGFLDVDSVVSNWPVKLGGPSWDDDVLIACGGLSLLSIVMLAPADCHSFHWRGLMANLTRCQVVHVMVLTIACHYWLLIDDVHAYPVFAVGLLEPFSHLLALRSQKKRTLKQKENLW